MVIFNERRATRIHPMQVWLTPFCFDEYAAAYRQRLLNKIGNAELVRGISELLSLAAEISPGRCRCSATRCWCRATRRMFEAHHWIADTQAGDFAPLLHVSPPRRGRAG